MNIDHLFNDLMLVDYTDDGADLVIQVRQTIGTVTPHPKTM